MKYGKISEKNDCFEAELGLIALRKMLNFLKNAPVSSYQINGWMRILVQDDKKMVKEVDSEAHKRFHDIFYLMEGSELTIYQGEGGLEDGTAQKHFGVASNHSDAPVYSEDKDIGFVKLDNGGVVHTLEGDAYVHYAPGDWHASQIAIDDKPVRKIVVKILDCKFWTPEMLEASLLDDIGFRSL